MVLLLTDSSSAIDALVQESRVSGIVEGSREDAIYMRYVLKFKDYQVRPKDLVITSGLDGIFPKGLVIGRVHKARLDAPGLFQEIEVRPRIDLRKLEYVLVLDRKGKAK